MVRRVKNDARKADAKCWCADSRKQNLAAGSVYGAQKMFCDELKRHRYRQHQRQPDRSRRANKRETHHPKGDWIEDQTTSTKPTSANHDATIRLVVVVVRKQQTAEDAYR